MPAKKSRPKRAVELIRERIPRLPVVSPTPDGPGSVASDADLYRLVGERVLMFRHRAKLSQLALAERVGVTRTSITNLEQGKQRPPLGQLMRIASALELADYRRLLPTPEELAVAVLGPAEGLASDHPFWAHVRRLLWRTFASPTEEITVVHSTLDVVEVLIDDTNPLRPESVLILVRPRPTPVTRAHVAQLLSRLEETQLQRSILITSGTFEPDAVALATERSVTLINGVAVTHLQDMLSAARGPRQTETRRRVRAKPGAPADAVAAAQLEARPESQAGAPAEAPAEVPAAPSIPAPAMSALPTAPRVGSSLRSFTACPKFR